MTETDDLKLEQLVRQAGHRTPLPEDIKARLEESFRKELQQARQKELRRKVQILVGIAASIILAVTLMVLNSKPPELTELATVERSKGQVFWQHEDQSGPLRSGNQIQENDIIRTAEGWLALKSKNIDINIRLDRETEIQFLGGNSVRLFKGSLYIDSGTSTKSRSFRILTDGITVEHVGTQYLVSSDSSGISVAVREGEIIIATKNQRIRSSALGKIGQLTKIGEDHQFTTTDIITHGPRWAWANQVAPQISIDGMSLDHFLHWVARQTGMTIRYESPAIQEAAVNMTLAGPHPTEAGILDILKTAMRTTPFHASIANGEISIGVQTDS